MESQQVINNSIKPFKCPFHPSERIERVCIDQDIERSLQCIECVLEMKTKTSKDQFYPLADFITYAAKQYETLEHTLSFAGAPPSNLVDFLAYEEKKTKVLEKHIDREKQRVEESFNSILQEFTLLCHNKKEEMLTKLDNQLVLSKRNYQGYRAKIDKYFNNEEDQQNDMESLIERINKCYDASDFEILVRNIKEDIVKSNSSEDSQSIADDIQANLMNFAQELKRQSNALPKLSFNDLASINKSLEEVKKLMEELSEIHDPIVDIHENVLAFDSKILKKQQHTALLKKWLSSEGRHTKLKLLYRGSRDTFSASVFHEKCDAAPSTLTIARSTNGNIFGGYSDQTWQVTNNYKQSKNCWLFSMDHKEKYPVKINAYATYTNSAYGPAFGSGHDLYVNLTSNGTGCYSNLGTAYECSSSVNSTEKQSRLAGSYQFAIDEIEVYAVGASFRSSDSSTLDSLILDPTKDVKLIHSWTTKVKNMELELIYRGSRDGFDAQGFHTFCDDQGPTLVVCKAATTGKVFGGYTSENWSKENKFVADRNAYLFSISNSSKHPVRDSEHAIYCNEETGPIFGEGYDLFIASDSHKNSESTSSMGVTYKANEKVGDLRRYLAGDTKFKLAEIEVFRVITNFQYALVRKAQNALRSRGCNSF